MADSTLRFRDRTVLENYLKDISKIPLITAAEERELARRIKDGDLIAKKKLVEANLRYVVSVANNYAGYGMPLEDLINEGNVGLMEAAKRFDPSLGVRFLSYAVWWIRSAILGALADRGRPVRLPRNKVSDLCRIFQASRRLGQEGGEDPSYVEIASEVGMSPRQVHQAMAVGRRHRSLDAVLEEEEGMMNDE